MTAKAWADPSTASSSITQQKEPSKPRVIVQNPNPAMIIDVAEQETVMAGPLCTNAILAQKNLNYYDDLQKKADSEMGISQPTTRPFKIDYAKFAQFHISQKQAAASTSSISDCSSVASFSSAAQIAKAHEPAYPGHQQQPPFLKEEAHDHAPFSSQPASIEEEKTSTEEATAISAAKAEVYNSVNSNHVEPISYDYRTPIYAEEQHHLLQQQQQTMYHQYQMQPSPHMYQHPHWKTQTPQGLPGFIPNPHLYASAIPQSQPFISNPYTGVYIPATTATQQPSQPVIIPPIPFERKKTILSITNPHTGASVIPNAAAAATSSKAPNEQPIAPSIPAAQENISDSSFASVDVKIVLESQTPPTPFLPALDSVIFEEKPNVPEAPTDQQPQSGNDSDEASDIEEEDSLILLSSNDQVPYPESVKCCSRIKAGDRLCYSLEFLKQFLSQVNHIPDDIEDGEFRIGYTGIVSPNYIALSLIHQQQFSSGGQATYLGNRRNDPNRHRREGSGRSAAASSSGGRSGGRSRKDRSSAGSSRRQPGSSSIVISPEALLIELHCAESSWSKAAAAERASTLSNEDLVRKEIISILNKLSTDNFDDLYSRIRSLSIDSLELFTEIVSRVYDKAVAESAFADVYAMLVKRLASDYKTFPGVPQSLLDKTGSVTRALVLGRCQREYEKRNLYATESWDSLKLDAAIPDLDPIDRPEGVTLEQYWRAKLKRRSLGNLKFVGELFKLGVISEIIIVECLLGLVEQPLPGEEELESLAKLLRTTATKLNVKKCAAALEKLFGRIEELSCNPQLSSRSKFILLDLIDERAAGWDATAIAAMKKKAATSSTYGKAGGASAGNSSRSSLLRTSKTFQNGNTSSLASNNKNRQEPPSVTHSQNKFEILKEDSNDSHAAGLTSPTEERSPPIDLNRLINQVLVEYASLRDCDEVAINAKLWNCSPHQLIVPLLSECIHRALWSTKLPAAESFLELISYLTGNFFNVQDLPSTSNFNDLVKEAYQKGLSSTEDALIDVPHAKQNLILLSKSAHKNFPNCFATTESMLQSMVPQPYADS